MSCRHVLQAIKVHVEAEKSLLADSINTGPMAELQVKTCTCMVTARQECRQH
jgi:hypothetical protein